jgi:hypothetical protein
LQAASRMRKLMSGIYDCAIQLESLGHVMSTTRKTPPVFGRMAALLRKLPIYASRFPLFLDARGSCARTCFRVSIAPSKPSLLLV